MNRPLRPTKAFNRWAAKDALVRCMANYRVRGPRLQGNLQMAVDRAERNGVESKLLEEARGLLTGPEGDHHGE